jgi:hypothetical protein
LKCSEIPKTDSLLDASLMKVVIPYSLRKSPSMPSGKNTVWLSATNNGSYAAAFTALSGGLKVERTSTAVTFGENTFPAGSFVISAGKDSYDALNRLIQSLTYEPFFWIIQSISSFNRLNFLPWFWSKAGSMKWMPDGHDMFWISTIYHMTSYGRLSLRIPKRKLQPIF